MGRFASKSFKRGSRKGEVSHFIGKEELVGKVGPLLKVGAETYATYNTQGISLIYINSYHEILACGSIQFVDDSPDDH